MTRGLLRQGVALMPEDTKLDLANDTRTTVATREIKKWKIWKIKKGKKNVKLASNKGEGSLYNALFQGKTPRLSIEKGYELREVRLSESLSSIDIYSFCAIILLFFPFWSNNGRRSLFLQQGTSPDFDWRNGLSCSEKLILFLFSMGLLSVVDLWIWWIFRRFWGMYDFLKHFPCFFFL